MANVIKRGKHLQLQMVAKAAPVQAIACFVRAPESKIVLQVTLHNDNLILRIHFI